MTRYFTSSDSIVTSLRRVEIQSMSEMTPYFTMTKCNKLFKLHTFLAQLNTYQVFHRVFQPFQPFHRQVYTAILTVYIFLYHIIC